MNEKTLGEHIRDARVAKGSSLRELARQLTITPSRTTGGCRPSKSSAPLRTFFSLTLTPLWLWPDA